MSKENWGGFGLSGSGVFGGDSFSSVSVIAFSLRLLPNKWQEGTRLFLAVDDGNDSGESDEKEAGPTKL